MIPDLKTVTSVRANTGTATVLSVNGNELTISLTGGNTTRNVQTGGRYTPGDSKSAYTSLSSPTDSFPSTTYYSEGNYSGTLSKSGSSLNYGSFYAQGYSGTIYSPSSDTRTYDYYYQYTVTVVYEANAIPAVTLTSPSDNLTLYENDTFNINGNVIDADNSNTVTVRYQINAFTTRAIKAFLSDGSTLESFSKSLTFKGGNLYDGDTLVASNLSDGVAHTLKVWATDDQGGTSTIREIPFYVVPNRAPLLTVNGPVISGSINSDKFTVNGTFEDSDGNNTIVSYRLNGASSVQVAEGVSGSFEFELSFGQLVIGANEIVVEAVDSYGAKVSKTVKLNKVAVETPLLKSTARYKVNPPNGSAKAVLLWIQRDANLSIDAAISMGMQGEAESYTPLTALNSAPVEQGSPIVEDEFYHEADGPKDNIILQIDMERASLEVDDKIYLISGVLD